MYNIIIYEDENGKSEIAEYLRYLQERTNKDNRIKFNKVSAYIELLSLHGLNLKEPYIKKLDKDIWELRPLRDRILFTTWYNNKFILLSIFMKKTQKTPKSEIKKAKKLLEDYKRRCD